MQDVPASASVPSSTATTISRSRRPASPAGPKPNRSNSFLLLFGVILPVITLTIEFVTHQCADIFFDPIPTWWHILLVALVPASNLAVWIAALRQECPHPRLLGWLNGIAIGVAIAYALAFTPLVPIAVPMIIFFGWGMLPLTPALSLIASVLARRALVRIPEVKAPPVWLGMAAALGVFALQFGQHTVTHYGLHLAASSDEATERNGIRILRYFGSRRTMLEQCYAARRSEFGQWSTTELGWWTSTEAAQKIFYRVTGDPYNSLPAPTTASPGRGRNAWNFDPGVGGTEVADKVAGLSMTTSRVEGRVDPAASASYVEWTMIFKNVAANASEARAQIELPDGGVVSRLTLWVNGEPREAAFGGRNQVRAAYQEIAVVQRRDPVLVTTSGPNRILMQCFPVPPRGGEMKVRVGITAPLRLLDAHRAQPALPRLLETNFEQSDSFQHDLSLATTGAPGPVERRISEKELRARPTLPAIEIPAGEAWSEDPLDPAFVIRQTVRPRTVAAPRHIAFVVDGSKAMSAHRRDIADAIATLPAGQSFSLHYAADELETLPEKADPAAAAKWLRDRDTLGGRDNLPALLRAWDEADAAPDRAIVWIHGPQPVLLSSIDPLLQRLDRAKNAPAFYDLPVEPAANRALDSLGTFRNLRAVSFGGTPGEDLRHLLALWSGKATDYIATRERIPRPDALPDSEKGDRDIARLWGLEEVERLRFTPEAGSLDRAIRLALTLQLVTPVSGAVVLETQEQYDRHKLTPTDPETAPTVPEPATALLLASTAALWLGTRRRRSS